LGKVFTYGRQPGELLHPEREPLEILDQLRETMGEYQFAAQYQQNPAPLGGGIVKHEWLKFYSERPERFDFIFQSWDTANKASELNDYSVCTTWGVVNKKLFLLDVLRRRMEYPELKRIVAAHALEWGAKNVLIEDRASGTQLLQELKREGMSTLTRCDSKVEKKVRMFTASNLIENGSVYLPEKAPWLATYIHELVTFDNGKYDDQVDSTSQALTWYKGCEEPGIIAYYREETIRMWRARQIRWEQLTPKVQQYILDNGLQGPRPGGLP
jgi:predicted phage terminase large subunit-like protein